VGLVTGEVFVSGSSERVVRFSRNAAKMVFIFSEAASAGWRGNNEVKVNGTGFVTKSERRCYDKCNKRY